jgi:4-hydroxybenzoate polyprenyltransferase
VTAVAPSAAPRLGALRGLVLATHFGPTVAVVTYATATAVASDLSTGRCVLLAVAVALGQASVGWSNDWIDAPVDVARGRGDKPIARGWVRREVVGAAAVIALVLCIPTSLALGWRAGVAHLVAVGAAWAYNLGLKRTVTSPVSYLLAFGLVPVVVAAALPGHPRAPWALVVASGLLGVSAHLTNAVKDLVDDEATGIRGLPQRLGLRASTALSTVVLTAAIGIFLTIPGRWEPATVALGVVAVLLSLAASVRAWQGRLAGLFELSILSVAPLVVAVAITGGVLP